MIGLFFDVRPKPGHMPRYFEHVDRLKPALAGHDGLLYLERFRPLDDAEALLSHQHWQDEEAIRRWRENAAHRASQSAGRRVHFEAYRLRVGPRTEAASGEAGRFLVAAYGAAPAPIGRGFESVTRPGRFLTLAEAATGDAARGAAGAAAAGGADRVLIFALSRDYSMTDRAEAPTP